MKKTKRVFLVLVWILFLSMMVFAGGKQGPSGTAVTVEHVVQVNLQDGDPGTLDPMSAFRSSRKTCLMQVFERLAVLDKEGRNLVNVLAKDIQRAGLTYTITLHDNIYDSAGNHFTADDVIFCVNTLQDMGTNSDVNNIAGMQKIDDYNFTMTMKSDLVGIFEAIVTRTYLCTQAAYKGSEDGMKTNPVGTGPYMLESLESGSSLTLVKNDDYWAKDNENLAAEQMANTDKIIFRIVTESAQAVVGLESGTLDVSFLDFSAAGRFLPGGEVADNFSAEVTDTWGGNALFLNLSDKSVFKDNLALRKAVLYGINRQEIVDGAFDGNAINPVCYGQIRYPDANPKWANENYFDYDVDAAKKYLAEAGYQPNKVTLRLLFGFQSYTNTAAQIIQANLAKVGIKVEVMGLDPAIAGAYETDPTRWDLMFKGAGGPGYISTKIWNRNLNAKTYSKDGSYCCGFISDPHLQKLLEASINVETHNQGAVDAVHYYLIEQAYLMQMYCEKKCCVSNNKIVKENYLDTDTRVVPGASIYVWN